MAYLLDEMNYLFLFSSSLGDDEDDIDFVQMCNYET